MLPIGSAVLLGRRTRVVSRGTALLGGTPTRLVRLTARARPMLEGRRIRIDSPAAAALADRLLEWGLAEPELATLRAPEDASVTYVIPIRDRPQALDRLLASIGPGAEVVVVDDASHDPGAVAAVAARRGAAVLPLAVNVGPAAARNAGLAAAATPFVVFVDSDIVLEPDTVPILLRHFADPEVALVAPRIAGLGDRPSWLGRFEDTRSSLDLGPHPAAVRPRSPLAWVTTACVVARREALTMGFDGTLRIGEDVDLGWRLVDAGWRVRYEPTAVARHEHREAPLDWFLRKAVYGSGAQGLAERHPDYIAPAVLAPWSAAFVVLLLLQRRWSWLAAALVAATAGARIARVLRPLDHAVVEGMRLAGAGAVSAGAQAMALLLRHWWPVALVGCLVSRRMRRAVLVSALVDVALEYRRNPAHLDPVRFAIARRLDDLAYGAGVWWGALRAGSLAALKPAIIRRSTS
ncbi:mycofactocin biosynthesis glycosyltransferase MftF [Amnibacterium sp.]|uniref:mycofactocin biosynthesis glycosyltransferase MftF n=1 Tax=Amnibacterium sp. TaxID=1872496 RepID=UPI003F7BA0B7